MSWQTARCVRYVTCLHPTNHGSPGRGRFGFKQPEEDQLKDGLAQRILCRARCMLLVQKLTATFRSERELKTGSQGLGGNEGIY